MWVVRFKSEFIPETTFQLYSLYHDNANLVLHPGTCFNRLVSLCEMMDAELHQASKTAASLYRSITRIDAMVVMA